MKKPKPSPDPHNIPRCDLNAVNRIAHYCAAIAFHGGLVSKEEAQAMREAVAEIEARRKAMEDAK